MPSTKKLIGFPDKIHEKVLEIMEEKGYPTYTAVIHQAVITLYDKMAPAYTKSKMKKAAVSEYEDKAKMKFVEKLNGKVETRNGQKVCIYYTYNGKDRFEQILALNLLTQELIKTQYYPDKERVEKWQADGKVNY